ncbi:hypothetical protein GGI21_000212 [Coemansia aciculifera]|nr:hypothetical protein GGI21_000212 [Coemansia aciculifera]
MSKLDTITGRMSKLMLRRWPMLAEQCPEAGCNAPLMRNPESGDTKCVWHDASELFPDEVVEVGSPSSLPSYDGLVSDEKQTSSSINEQSKGPAIVSPKDKSSDNGDAAQADDELAKVDYARQRRREQSDLASQLIAKRLLQGWAMIDQACPNESCYSVPLVQDRDKTQQCVICEQRYMDEDAYVKKFGALPPAAAAISASTSSSNKSSKPVPTPTSKPSDAKELADLPSPTTDKTNSATIVSSSKEFARSADVEATRPVKRRHGSAAVDVAVKALEDKLAQLAAQLAETTDLRAICSISKAMSACVRAIHECQSPRQLHR